MIQNGNGGVVQKMEGGCLFNIVDDPTEHNDLAKDPAMVPTLKKMQQRYLELRATKLDQTGIIAEQKNRTRLYLANYIAMLRRNRGFVGPWCSTDGACAPVRAAPPADTPGDVPYDLGLDNISS